MNHPHLWECWLLYEQVEFAKLLAIYSSKFYIFLLWLYPFLSPFPVGSISYLLCHGSSAVTSGRTDGEQP